MQFLPLLFIFLTATGFTTSGGAEAEPVPTGASFRNEFLTRVNAVRAKGCNCGGKYMPPAPALKWNDELEKAANAHARDMKRQGYFSHTSRNGNTVKDRIVKAGYSLDGYMGYSYGENIAAGQRSIGEVMASWIKSPGHCKNLMNPNFREIGVGENDFFWVQNFGMRQSFFSEKQSK
jgi:uncharacterized protein YkwD